MVREPERASTSFFFLVLFLFLFPSNTLLYITNLIDKSYRFHQFSKILSSAIVIFSVFTLFLFHHGYFLKLTFWIFLKCLILNFSFREQSPLSPLLYRLVAHVRWPRGPRVHGRVLCEKGYKSGRKCGERLDRQVRFLLLKDLRLRIDKWASNRSKLRKIEGVYPCFMFRTSLKISLLWIQKF